VTLRVLITIIACAGLSPCLAQSAAVADQIRQGFQHYGKNEIEPAQQRFEQALALATEERDTSAQAECHRMLGVILNRKAEYPAARVELDQALALFQSISQRKGVGLVYNALGFNAWGMGDLARAAELYRQALVEFEATGALREKADALYSLAFMMPHNEERRLLMSQNLELARQIGYQKLEGQILHSDGDRDFGEGDFASALAKLEPAAEILEKAGARGELSRVLTSLGRLYRAHGHPDRALELYRRTLKVQEEIGDRQGVIQSINMMAVAYDYLGRTPEALEHFQRALTLARQTGSPKLINDYLNNVAGAYLTMGEYSRAAELLEEVVRAATSWLPHAYSNLGRAYAGLGRYSEALEMAEKSVEKARENGGDTEALVYALDGRALTRHKMGSTSEALADIREALQIIEQMRARLVPTDFMKRGFSGEYQDLVGSAISMLHESGEHSQALEFAEQARARAFLDLLATREAAPTSANQSLLMRGGAAGADLRSIAQAKAFSASQMSAAAARLRSTVLAYWVSKDAIFAWVTSPNGTIRSVRVKIASERLQQLIRETSVGTQSRKRGEHESEAPAGPLRGGDVLLSDDSQKTAWRELHRLLIASVRSLLPKTEGSRLTIIPHGPLFQVSFAALLDKDNRYLVERYTLHYVPAAGLLEFTQKRRQHTSVGPRRYLLVADPAGPPSLPDGKSLPPLPGSRREAEAIAALLPRGATTVLTGEQAGEDAVRAGSANRRIVHFATHGILRNDRPFESFLALGAAGIRSASTDGRLTASEVYDLNLSADLVVLSACRTGLGKISGDGIAGLTRAFFYAGTPSVVATLWDVADEPTYLLVTEFYRSLGRGSDKSEALRSAQLRLLQSLRAGQLKVATPAGDFTLPEHPVFWAGFVLQGEP
jgi:CHAT domain-containing protein/Tfp pilus assembly protein PilF